LAIGNSQAAPRLSYNIGKIVFERNGHALNEWQIRRASSFLVTACNPAFLLVIPIRPRAERDLATGWGAYRP
jgi:hypothetical protein